MSNLYYAAYGSNLHPERLQRRLASARLAGTDFLPDFTLHFLKRGADGSGKCTILPGERGVHFAVYSIDTAEKPLLDRIEGAGHGYDLVTLELPGFGACFSYLASASHFADDLPPFCWYREMVLQGCRLHGFPADYVAAIDAIVPLRDPDHDRRRSNWAIVDRML